MIYEYMYDCFVTRSAKKKVHKFNEPKIIEIGQLEAMLFDILILGSISMDVSRKIGFSTFLLMKPLMHVGMLGVLIYERKQPY